jgi:hypothetical protein
MKHPLIVLALFLGLAMPLSAGTHPMYPAPDNSVADPGTPEARRSYKIHVLEHRIAEDKATLTNPGSGKPAEIADRIQKAKENLQLNQELLEKIKAGADHEVYFCSECGKEYMKVGTCPHCKKPLKDLFLPGAKRPMAQQQAN